MKIRIYHIKRHRSHPCFKLDWSKWDIAGHTHVYSSSMGVCVSTIKDVDDDTDAWVPIIEGAGTCDWPDISDPTVDYDPVFDILSAAMTHQNVVNDIKEELNAYQNRQKSRSRKATMPTQKILGIRVRK